MRKPELMVQEAAICSVFISCSVCRSLYYRLAELEEKFFTCVKVDEVVGKLAYEAELISFVYEYWKTKRKSNFSQPLLAPKGTLAPCLTTLPFQSRPNSIVAVVTNIGCGQDYFTSIKSWIYIHIPPAIQHLGPDRTRSLGFIDVCSDRIKVYFVHVHPLLRGQHFPSGLNNENGCLAYCSSAVLSATVILTMKLLISYQLLYCCTY